MASRPTSTPPVQHRRARRLVAGLAGGVLLLPVLGAAAYATGPVPAAVAPGERAGTIDDAVTGDAPGAITYSPEWFLTPLPEAHEGHVHATDVVGATWTVPFEGDAVSVTAPVGPLQGRVAYAVDGGEPVVVDHYASEIAVATVWTSPVLEPGAHVLSASVVEAGGVPRKTVGVDAVTAHSTGAALGSELVVVSPAPVTSSGATYTIPAVSGLEYVVDGVRVEPGVYPFVGRVLVDAQPVGGHVLAPTVRSRWILLPPPTENVHVSDLEWVAERSGRGPVGRDVATGGPGAGGGRALTLDGLTYDKGLGVHGDSAVRLYLGGQCSAFRSTVGIDDAQGAAGSVAFSVVADGEALVTTPVLEGGSAGYLLDVDVTGADYLDLVTDAGTDELGDDATWARARLICGDVLVRGIAAPTVADAPGTGADRLTVPAVEGVEYLVDGVAVPAGEHSVTSATVVVSVRALAGYQLDPDRVGPRWAFAFDVPAPEPTTPEPTREPTPGETAGETDGAEDGASDEPTVAPAGHIGNDPGAPAPAAPGSDGAGTIGSPAGPGLARTGAGGAGALTALGMLLMGVLATAVGRRGAHR